MRPVASVAISILLLGCSPELPPLEYFGERVVVGSDVVDEVCGGTLARLDREVVQIEKRLDLPPQAERLQIYIVSAETLDAHCDGANCTMRPERDAPFVLLDYSLFGPAAAHELVHARLAGQPAAPLFSEGVAEAVSPPSCPRFVPHDLAAADFLGAKSGYDLGGIARGYYASGEFVSWVLDEFGAAAFLRLYADVDTGASAATIEAVYRRHFDREIVDDLFAHLRTQADLDTLPAEYFGCLAPPPPTNDGEISLQATLDCNSVLVHNTPGLAGKGYVEWTLTLEHEQRFELLGAVPEWTALSVQPCACVPKRGQSAHLLPRPFDELETFEPGTYRLRWMGALDEGHTLDLQLRPVGSSDPPEGPAAE
jgi:hypothetical protein